MSIFSAGLRLLISPPLAACFQDLVDKAIDRVYYPTSFKNRRMDAQCVSVIIMMLRVLYGLNDKLEM